MMADKVGNLILEQLRQIHAAQEAMREDTYDIKHRISAIEQNTGNLQGQMGQMQILMGALNTRIDRIDERLERVERRLDRVEA